MINSACTINVFSAKPSSGKLYLCIMKKILILSLLLLLSTTSFGAFVAVLETGADNSAKDRVSISDRQYLTNVLREQAVKELPADQNWTIMTRENIMQMLPPGKAIEECEGSCLVETGKNIAADFVCQARVGSFGGMLTLSAELYETAGNKLIASFNVRGADVNELLVVVEVKSPEFFRSVKKIEMKKFGLVSHEVVQSDSSEQDNVKDSLSTEVTAIDNKVVESEAANAEVENKAVFIAEDSLRASAKVAYGELDGKDRTRAKENFVGESIPANVEDEPAKKRGLHWVPLSISAVVTVTGVVLAVVGNNKAKNAAEKKVSSMSEFDKIHKDAESGQTTRGVGVGLAIAGTVGIVLSFAF